MRVLSGCVVMMCLFACDLAPRGEVISSAQRGSLKGAHACTCFIGLSPSDDRAETADLDCSTAFGDIAAFVPMPPRADVAFEVTGSSDLTAAIDFGSTRLPGPLGGTFNVVIELGAASSERATPSGGKWVNYPVHARLDIPKQRLCELGAALFGHDCGDPLYGFDLEEGALTLDGQCEAAYRLAESHWP